MYDVERRKKILDLLAKNKSMSVARLASLLFVSPPTVRRDLAALSEEGLVARTHGGAVLRDTSEKEIPLPFREEQNDRAKRVIAERARAYITDGSVIFLDASSTVLYLVPHLEGFRDLVVITNSPKTSLRLAEYGVRSYSTGGLMLLHSVAYVGSEAERFVSGINADLFFFSSRGYTEDGRITDVQLYPVELGMDKPRPQKGVPVMNKSEQTLNYLQTLCEPFGTKLEIRDGVGHLCL